MSYEKFLESKRHGSPPPQIVADDLNPSLFPFQRELVQWSLRRGRAAVFADCGLGKSIVQLEWARVVAAHSRKPVLILTPLAVSHQVVSEGAKFGIEVHRSIDGSIPGPIVVTNYERLHHFSRDDFAGVVCDESSILKNFGGARRAEITEFMRTMPYRLLCTATAAPNDYDELGTSSEALGDLGYMDMLARFFKSTQNDRRVGWSGQSRMKWRLKGHAARDFWQWISCWARACRKPSDLGFDDEGFDLPPLTVNEHVVKARTRRPDMLFDFPAQNLREEREERRRTIVERCEKVAELVSHDDQALVWCHLNDEGDTLESMIPGSEQVAGKDSDDTKEARLTAFQRGDLRVLVTKPKIGAWGLNLQRCAYVTFFPSHSYEQYYQGVRRCWRFGQKRPVVVDIVSTEGERGVADNMARKAAQADEMFRAIIEHMSESNRREFSESSVSVEVPSWL